MTSFAACLPNYLLHKLYVSSLTSTCSRWIPLVSLLQMFLKYVQGPDDGFILIIRYTQRSQRFSRSVCFLTAPSCTLGASLQKTKPKPPWSCSARFGKHCMHCALCACAIVSPFHDSPSSLVQKTANARGCKMNQDESRWIKMNQDEMSIVWMLFHTDFGCS